MVPVCFVIYMHNLDHPVLEINNVKESHTHKSATMGILHTQQIIKLKENKHVNNLKRNI